MSLRNVSSPTRRWLHSVGRGAAVVVMGLSSGVFGDAPVHLMRPGGSEARWIPSTSTVYAMSAASPTPMPGTIQAEDFDEGGSGVSYVDTTPGNAGGQLRATDVDIEATSDVGGGYNVGWAVAGEWLAYTVNVSTSGVYDLDIRVASNGAGGTFHLEANGVDKTGPLTVPDTGGWQAWTTVRRTGVSLAAGQQIWRLVMDSNGSTGGIGNFNYIRATSASGSSGGGTPALLPGTLQVEDFDNNGAGVSFVDTTPENSGGQYRDTAVDIESTADSGGGYNVGWAVAGEWLKYTVTVASAGSYDLDFRVASAGAGGTFHLEADGVDKTGTLTVPDTGGWQMWTTVRRAGVSLSAGQQVWRLVMDSNGSTSGIGNFNYIRATSTPASGSGAPHGGTPAALPGTLQVEDFDDGGAGVSFVDTTPENSGGQYRDTAVDIEATPGGGYNIGWAVAGEWLKYTVTVASAGKYDLDFRIASAGAGGTFHLEVNGADATGPLAVPDTGGWQTWSTIRRTGVSLPAGVQTWRLVMDTNGSTSAVGNFNYIRALAPNVGSPYGGTALTLPGTIQAENFDDGGAEVAYHDTTPENSGGQYRTTGVDIETTTDAGGGYNLAWAFAGEWLNYSVNVSASGTYDLDVRAASAGPGGTFHIEVDGADKTGPLTVPNTGSWQTWTTIRKSAVSLTAGAHIMRLVLDTNGSTAAVGNFNWIRLSPSAGIAILRAPYLQQVSDLGAIVVWTTRDPGNAEVRYFTGTSAPVSTPAEMQLFPASQTGLPYDYYQYEAHLSGLRAATRYTYDVFMAGSDATPGQDSFTTAPSPGNGSIRFIAFGDSGVGSTQQQQLAARMTSDTFDLALHTGDVAYGTADLVGGGSYPQYEDWFFSIYSSWLRSRPVFPSIGNHDDEIANARAYRDVFVLPEQGGTATYPDNAERYYSFDYGPVHFVALDTEFAFLDPARRQAQLSWVDADLASTTQPWRVVYFHRSPYSSGAEHGSMLDVRQAFGPIFERRHVDLVLSGHDHDYERSIPVRDFVSDGGFVTYVVTGGGGAALYPVGQGAWTAASASVHHYVRAAVSNCTLTLEAVGLDGAVFDRAAIDHCAANQPPQVSITGPANGMTTTVGNNVPVSAAANDADGSVARVDFFAGSTPIGSATGTSPSVMWSPSAAGTYSLTAVAMDDDGATARSAPVTVTVNPAANQPPATALTSPANNATFTAPATITLSATASDPENSVARVEFYSGTTLLATDNTSPYSFTWSSVPAGTYSLRSIAYDTAGASATSASVTINVSAPVTPPPTGVVFQASVDHATLVTRYDLRIFANGANPNTATPIATSDLGKGTPDANGDITVDRSAFFSGLAPGTYVAAVAAIGSGGSSTSTGVTFTR